MTTATRPLDTFVATPPKAVATWVYRVGGLLMAALVPALFWPVVLSFGAALFGTTISLKALAGIGGGIGLFVAAVCAPIMLRT